VSDDFTLVAIEAVAMAIRTCWDMTRDDGITPFANFKIARRLNDLLRPGGALGKMAVRHVQSIHDCSSLLNRDTRIGQFFDLHSLFRNRFNVHRQEHRGLASAREGASEQADVAVVPPKAGVTYLAPGVIVGRIDVQPSLTGTVNGNPGT
jgi:hypothetical protein